MPSAQAVDAESCQGKPATIVQPTGTVTGTDGDDVIVAGDDGDPGATTTVSAGAGNDTVCVVGGGFDTFDGGNGVDSVRLVGEGQSGILTVRDFEHLDVRTGFNLGEIHLEWTRVPSELSGEVVGDDYSTWRAQYLDNPTLRLVTPEAGGSLLMVDMRHDRVSLGEGLGFTMSGFPDVGATGPKIRFFGDERRNFAFLTGCDVVARGGGASDRLWAEGRKIDRACPGVRFYGQGGPDWLVGTSRNDVLMGGPGPRDRAFGRTGRDRCVAEQEARCER